MMKTLDIAFKDLKHIFLSVFSLIMMFGAPLLITGLLYFAFGGMSSGKSSFNLPVTRVVVANLDRPVAQSGGTSGGAMLVDFLRDESLAELLQVSLAAGEAEARRAVDEQQAGVAVIIPPDFSAAAFTPDQITHVTVYQDPTLTIGPSIVRDLVNHYMDAFSGAKIASQVAAGPQANPQVQAQVIQSYTAWIKANGHDESAAVPRLSIVSPSGAAQAKATNQGAALIGPIMAGMLVFFVFFMGANGAESIIREDEQGTLARLFTTPTAIATLLGGKFLGIVISLCIQVAVLLLASTFLFQIQWGQPATVLLVSAALILVSAGFGILLMSFVKNSRQTGPVLGGVMTLTAMLGGVFTTAIPNAPAALESVTLSMPQGWALQSWKIALAGAGPTQVVVPVLVLLALAGFFFAAGAARFQRRYA
jgi:ABC-2 type transport system permease protein